MVADADGGAKSGILDSKLLDAVTGTDYMTYWLWRCRDSQMDWSEHPLRQTNKGDLEYIIPTRE